MDFSIEEREHYDLHDAANLELKLREGETSDAIDNLKKEIRNVTYEEYQADKSGTTRERKTKSGAILIRAREKRQFWAREYREVCCKMLKLGLSEEQRFSRPLEERDTYPLSTTLLEGEWLDLE